MQKRFKVFGKDIVLNAFSQADNSVLEEIFRDRDYKVVDEHIKQARNLILDIGAHKGYFSVYAALQNPGVRVLAYEPEADNFKCLKENLRINRIKNVQPKNLAVAAKEGVLQLHRSVDSHNHSVFGDGEVFDVQAVSLNTILDKSGSCELVKLDCEGAEFQILENLSVENFDKIKSFYIEYHQLNAGLNVEHLLNILKKQKFKIRHFPSHYDKRMGFILAEK